MNIMLLIDNFTPDLAPPSFRFESVVKELAKRGHKITIIASYPNRIDLDEFKEFEYENVKIIRINKRELKEKTYQRAINYFIYFYKSLKVGLHIAKNNDLIIATTPQLLIAVSGAIISVIRKKKFIVDVRDLWPDIVLDMGIMKKYNPIYLILKLLESFVYKQAFYMVYNSSAFFNYLEKKYNKSKMTLITNGIDNYILNYFKGKNLEVKKKKIYKILYAGNIGIAQDIIILTELAKKRKDINIILIGKGSQETLIKNRIKDFNIGNINIIKAVPRNEILKMYEEADILFLQLKNIKMFEKTIPSKIFEYLASQKPILFGVEGIAKELLIKEFNRKYYFEANNIESLSRTLDVIIDDIEQDKYIKPDIEKLEKNYSRERLSEQYADLIEKIIEK